MACDFELVISTPDRFQVADHVLTRCLELIEQIENEITEFGPQSPIYKINHGKVGQWVELPLHAEQILKLACGVMSKTSCAFDPTAKGTAENFGFRVESLEEATRLIKTESGAHLGFGAIGKGYALDCIRVLIEREGFENYLLNAGGSSIVVSGSSFPGAPWVLGWSWQKDLEGRSIGVPVEHRSGKPAAFGISGFSEKGAHILTAGAPIIPWIESAIVSCSSAAEADAWSTALMVSDESLNLMENESGFACAVVDRMDRIAFNRKFEQEWGAL